MYSTREEQETEKQKMSRAYFVRYMQELLLGRAVAGSAGLYFRKVSFSENIRYIHMELETGEIRQEPQEIRNYQKAVYAAGRQYLGMGKRMSRIYGYCRA